MKLLILYDDFCGLTLSIYSAANKGTRHFWITKLDLVHIYQSTNTHELDRGEIAF
jgi:hypothetical protein